MGQYGKAISYFTKSNIIDSENAHNLNKRAITYYILQEFDKALLDLDKVIQLDPLNSLAYYLKSLTYYIKKENNNAIMVFKKCKELLDFDDILVKTQLFYLESLLNKNNSMELNNILIKINQISNIKDSELLLLVRCKDSEPYEHMLKYEDVLKLEGLVNRLWCRLAIPLLWENPFSIINRRVNNTGNHKFIEICLYNLNSDLKSKLNEYKINDNLLPSNTLFNYPNFIKYLNTLNIIQTIKKWTVEVLKDLDSESEFRRLIQTSLFKVFIENEVKLHTLEIEVFSGSNYNSYNYDILELILQNANFIYNIRNLKLILQNTSLIHNIVNLKLIIFSKEDKLMKNLVLQIIYLHQNLKKLTLVCDDFSLYQSLLLSKDYNCSNTLNTIILHRVDFRSINNLNKIFDQLNVLESIHIIYCRSLNSSFIQQIINLSKPFKLKTLFTCGELKIELLILLLQKSGDYLENFRGDLSCCDQKLSELIIKYCKNLKFLDIITTSSQIIYQISNLIENINYLTINCGKYISSSILLQNLGQNLPSRLEYLNLILHIKASDFEIFLKNSQDTFIKKLLIKNLMLNGDDILPYIKEYIMKEKRVKYLTFKDISNNELLDLDDEVEEFKLHNIIIQDYSDLCINEYRFIQELY
ncbi:hypothetical protein C1646_673733 [Rhizophagus diaphanus]|nr:hypothetical protein C1646_673733 [Rhizophagus diaphanus] [Rhizophagus sp. MUCL 43196]